MAGDVFVTERQTVHAVSQFLIVNDLDFMPARKKPAAVASATVGTNVVAVVMNSLSVTFDGLVVVFLSD